MNNSIAPDDEETKWNVGCSGFHYPEWKEVFYPKNVPQSGWFEFYCQRFNSLEINGSFYRYPNVKTLSNWYHRSPAHFTFSIKVPRFITHFWKFKNVKEKLGMFYSVAEEGLREKLGCVLFQLHPTIAYSAEMLELIVSAIDHKFNNVIEFRHASWWNEQVYAALSREHITFCGISHPDLPDEAIINTPTGYFRFHGVPVLYSSRYSYSELRKVFSALDGHCREAWIYFNNTANGSAIVNAKAFTKFVSKREYAS